MTTLFLVIFSKLRQKSGGAYFISVQNALNEFKIRKNKLCLELKSGIFSFEKSCSHSCSKCAFTSDVHMCDLIVNLPKLEADLLIDVKMLKKIKPQKFMFGLCVALRQCS